MTDVKSVAARKAQSKTDKMRTLMLAKKPRVEETKMVVNGEELVLKFQAIGAEEIDNFRAKFPPSTEQEAKGATIDMDAYGPALVSRCLIEPELTLEEVQAIWKSEAWSDGELGKLLTAATAVNLRWTDDA